MSGRAVRLIGAVLLTGIVACGCGTQARWVNCAGRLQPINVPAPKAATTPANAEQKYPAPGGP